MNSKEAFTLVELLIVIIVIAILSAVSVIAYQGVNKRASNSAIASAVSTFEKYIDLYASMNGRPLVADRAVFDASSVGSQGNLGYSRLLNAGICLTSAWPSDTELATYQYVSGNAPPENKAVFCSSYYSNSSITLGTATDQWNTSFTNASAQDKLTLPRLPSIPNIQVQPNGHWRLENVRGIRYAHNSNLQTSYIYYALHGRTCLNKDLAVNFRTSFWGGNWTAASTDGGDDMTNDTVYCARIKTWPGFYAY